MLRIKTERLGVETSHKTRPSIPRVLGPDSVPGDTNHACEQEVNVRAHVHRVRWQWGFVLRWSHVTHGSR